MKSGTITSIGYRGGYGFITPNGKDSNKENDIFFHCTKVVDPNFLELKVDDRVDYIEAMRNESLQAVDVVAYQS